MHRDLHREVERRIADHGVVVQGVTEDIPGEGSFAYTIGNHRRGVPELIAFGLDPRVAYDLLTDLSRLTLLGEIRAEAGREVPGRLGPTGALPVRFGEVAPRWARHHAIGVYLHHPDDDPETIRVLQVVLPDAAGRFWDQPRFDLHMDQHQPDLSRPEWPWRASFEPLHLVREVAATGTAHWPMLVSVPIIDTGREEGRCEAVPAVWLDGDRALIQRPPVLADWVTVGTVVEADGEPEAETRIGPAHRYRHVVRESPYVHAAWSHRAEPEDPDDPVLATLADIEDDLQVVLSVTLASVHAAATRASSEALRLRMRRLVRDGLARELVPYHSPDRAEPPPGWVTPHPE